MLPAPFAAALLMAGLRLLTPEVPGLHYGQRLDLPGVLTLTAAMLLLVRTVVKAPGAGWGFQCDRRSG